MAGGMEMVVQRKSLGYVTASLNQAVAEKFIITLASQLLQYTRSICCCVNLVVV